MDCDLFNQSSESHPPYLIFLLSSFHFRLQSLSDIAKHLGRVDEPNSGGLQEARKVLLIRDTKIKASSSISYYT